jgi:thioredoxin 1
VRTSNLIATVLATVAVLAVAGSAAAEPAAAKTPAAQPAAATKAVITALSPEELDQALASGRWLVVEFGGESCIPCRAMQPILADVRTALKDSGKVHNFWVQQHMDTSRRFKIMVMPTQVIFDPKGNEVYRHQGFLEKDVFFTVLTGLGAI